MTLVQEDARSFPHTSLCLTNGCQEAGTEFGVQKVTAVMKTDPIIRANITKVESVLLFLRLADG